MCRTMIVLSSGRRLTHFVIFSLLLSSLAVLPAARADVDAPRANDRQVTLVVSSLMRREHLSKQELDDTISERSLKAFVNSIDPLKLYFLQADIDEFDKHDKDIDDMIRRGDISYAYTVYKRFLSRVDQRVAAIDQLLKGEFDFTLDEEMVIDPDKISYPKTAEEARDRWRKRIKYDLLVLKAQEELAGKEAIQRLTRRYHSFQKRMHQTDSDELLEMYLTSVTSSYDPHTSYMSPSSLENFRIQMSLKLEGIGAALQLKDGYTVITRVIPGGAADKSGKLSPEDRVVSVGQGPEGELVDVIDMKLGDVVKLIRGDAGTVVRLGVIPGTGGEMKTISITRAEIALSDSEARSVIFDDVKDNSGKPLKTGVIDLPSFYMDMEAARKGDPNFKSTTRDVRKILDDFNAKNVDVLVLDLRRNGGGSLTEAINLTGLFIEEGPVVQVKDSDGRVQHYDDLDASMPWKGPLVVLTSKFSASASEIFAGAIQDYHRGIVVGDSTTHGKGTVQSLLDLGQQLFRIPNPPNLGALKITMQQFYRPGGASTQKRGVLADVVLPSLTDHMDVSEDDLDYALEYNKVESTKFPTFPMTSEEQIKQLSEASAARRQKSEDFQKRARNIERYRKQKQRASLTLNEEKFMEERKELDADKEEEKQFEEQVNGSDEVVDRDYYFNEVLAITADYVSSLNKHKIAATGR